MELTTARQLAELNRRFYAQHAEAFAASRPRLPPGVRRILAQVPAGAAVLEVGCGDGKAGRWLAAHANLAAYLGLDLSPAMLERAQRLTADDGRLQPKPPSPATPPLAFALADLTAAHWPQVIAARAFDWILAFAVFHHLPGFEARAQSLRVLAEHLAPGGACVMSNWQFMRSERLKRRVVPWSALGLAEADVEPGDCLLAWERQGRRGLRYVHGLDEAEARRLARRAGLTVAEVFPSDGRSDDLADYVVMRPAAQPLVTPSSL